MQSMPLGYTQRQQSAFWLQCWVVDTPYALPLSKASLSISPRKEKSLELQGFLQSSDFVLWFLVLDLVMFFAGIILFCFYNPHTLCTIGCYTQGEFTLDSLWHTLFFPLSALHLKGFSPRQSCRQNQVCIQLGFPLFFRGNFQVFLHKLKCSSHW